MRVDLLLALVALPAAAQPITPTLLYVVDSPHPVRDGQFGHAVAAVGDLDGDGTADLAVGAPGETSGGALSNGRAYLVSGATGAIVHELTGQADADGAASFGEEVDRTGDLDGDGVPDVAVGAPNEGVEDFEPGAAYAFSGATGQRLYRWTSPEPQQWGVFGLSLVGSGDLTGDGSPDVVVADRGRLRIFNGTTGTLD